MKKTETETTRKKHYSFCSLYNCVSSSGTVYTGITVQGPLRIKDSAVKTTSDGNRVFSASMPIDSRSRRLAGFLGDDVDADAETVWADVSFWDIENGPDLATRMGKLAEAAAGRSIVATIVGTVRLAKSTGKDGKEYTRVRILVRDFNIERFTGSADSYGSGGESQEDENGSAQEASFVVIDDDEEDILPF